MWKYENDLLLSSTATGHLQDGEVNSTCEIILFLLVSGWQLSLCHINIIVARIN